MQKIDLQAARLSKLQERTWRWLQANPIYGTQGMILLDGELIPARFQRALQQSMQRYEILRTAFSMMPGMELPMQVIGHPIEISCPLVNLQYLDTLQQQHSLTQHWKNLQHHSFDHEHGPLLSITLFRLDTKQHVLLLRISALCADTNTVQYFSEEILRQYALSQQDTWVPDDEDVLQYIDVVSWQHDLLSSAGAEEEQAFWTTFDLSQLDSTRLPFTANKYHPMHPSMQQQQIAIVLDESDQQRLRDLSQRCEVSLETCLLTCWQILHWRLTSETPIIGVSCDGRPYEELTKALGPYTQNVPFMLALEREISFEQLLAETSQTLLEMHEKQFYFTWEMLTTKRSIQAQAFPISFTYTVWPEQWQQGPLRARIQQLEGWQEPSQIQLHVIQSGSQIQLQLHYQPDVLTMSTAQHLALRYHTLLQNAIASPNTSVNSLVLLTPSEQTAQLKRWLGQNCDWPFIPLQQRFQAHALRQPDAPALRYDSILLTYQQLDHLSNQLAHLLQTRGVTQADRVALYQPRDHWAIISLLAVLKAGACYIPLAEDLPPARVRLLLNDLRPTMLLSQQSLCEPLGSLENPVLFLEDLPTLLASLPITPPRIEVAPEQLAYIMYTSGSTGIPKGVEIRHESVSNYIEALSEALDVEAGWHFATVSNLAADLGNTAIFTALASGGCLHVLPYLLITDGAAFASYVEHYPLDVLKIVPSHLQALLAAGAVKMLPERHLILGGEALPWSLLDELQQLGVTCHIYNHYGPTEATIGALINPLGPLANLHLPPIATRGYSVPLGHPLPNMQICLLDAQQHQVPTGVIGELYLAGAGLAFGYFNAPIATQERFVTGVTSQKQVRWYRTGDLVRENEMGQLEFIGRRDNQVKVRGYRVELGEIETQLRNQPDVREAVVYPWHEELVGYLLAWKQPGPNLQKVREALLQILPSHMVPNRILVLDQFPLTANGKIDRQHLPEPKLISEPEPLIQSEPAHTPIEELLFLIWQEVLDLSTLGRHDNFFQLGGHSLLGTRVIARLQTIFEREIPITWLFDAPTIAGLAEKINQALQQEQDKGPPPLIPVSRQQPLPLSFAQQRLWFLDQLEPDSIAYTVPIIGWLHGPLVAHALEQSLLAIINRHEVLHTTFALHEGQPAQIIHPTSLIAVHWIDLTSLPEPERSQQAARLASQEIERPFDLQHGPLLRIHLIRCAPQKHALLLTMHHIISDARSHAIWLQEMKALYSGFISDTPAQLPALPIQYADYALWQRSWLQGDVLQQQLDYWKKQLANLHPLELPIDHPRPIYQSVHGAVHSLVLPETLNTALKQLSQKHGTTLFMTLLAAFQILLARSSGQTDIAVGTPIANRNRKEVEGLIGFFTNTLVLRSDLSDNPTFVELLTRVRRIALEAYTHQEVPFEQIVEALHPERDLSHSPLFQVLFQLQHADSSGEELDDDLTLDSFAQENVTAKFDLTLALFDTGQELYSAIEYNRDLFEPTTIQSWQERWQLLLEQLVHNPEQCVNQYSLITPQEQQKLLTWNTTQQDFADSRCLHELFTDQVTRTPDAIAVMGEEGQISYAALDHLSTHMAVLLRNRGVEPETLVGICLERSIELVVNLLGVLKAGGAYIPLDPEYPRERLAFLLTDAQASMLLTSVRFSELFSDLPLNVLTLESYWPNLATERVTTQLSQAMPQNPAYVIYTSGSTGRPKGVMISHAAITNHMHWMQETFSLLSSDRVLQKTPWSFDASIWEFYAPLLSGACLVLARPDTHRDSAALVQTILREQITILQVVPTLLQVLLDEPSLSACDSLHTLFCGGEELRSDLCLRALTTLPQHTRLCNLYGPTECTVETIYWICELQDQLAHVPIGQPISNTQLYLLDAYLQPVPIGVIGELYIGGAGLARCYHQQAALTAQAFLPHPFSQEAGARLYKTGDLARFLPERAGVLEYLGRSDAQVKLRGYRIELGEIEAVIRTHPAISAVAVGIQDRARGKVANQILVAYVVFKPAQSLSLNQLRVHVGEQLPQYMLPMEMVKLEQLPLSPSGKVDHRQLAAMKIEQTRESQEEEQGKHNELEELVLQVWQQVLQTEQKGIHDNFFEIGGHSLLATQVVSRLRRLVGVELPVRALFEAPTVAQLSTRLIQELQKGQGLQEVPEIVPSARNQDLPLSFTQQRLWFLHQIEPDSTAYSIPTAIHLDGQLNRAALDKALATIIERHEILRTTFPTHEGQPLQYIASKPTTQLVILDLSHLAYEKREMLARQLAQQEAGQPFDLARGPLLRCWLLQLTEQEEQVLLLTLHHIISDGWSMSILVRELTSLYTAFAQGQTISLPTLPVQYADYALWQRSWLQGEVLQRQLDYWKQQLANIAPLELPIDYPRPPIQTFRGARLELDLPNTLHQQLRELSQREGVTMFMTLLASFQVLLARYSGQEDIAVGTTIANRTHQEIEGLIGCFINMLVLRSDLSTDPSFVELLAQVRGVALQAYSYQDLPFEQVVEALQPQRDLSRSPLVQALFVMQNLPEIVGVQTPIESESLDLEQHVAKLELSVMAVERGQRLSISLGYNTDLFKASTIRRLFSHWQLLLEGIVAEPNQRLSSLPLVTPAEQEQILVTWNATCIDGPEHLYLHKLFEAQVERTPDTIAVVLAEVEITYQELNQKANQLAGKLQRLGVGPEERVGICLERSLEMVISVLAVLKAGGAYVPLDPNLPRTRFMRLLREVHPSLLLVSEKSQRQVPSTSAKMLFVEQELAMLVSEAVENPDVRISPDNLAYIVYTSGSTGQPKGIMIAHRGVANYLNYLAQTYNLDGSSTILQLASFTFDASVRDIFGTLTKGARLVLLHSDEFKEPQAIHREMKQHQVTAILSIVPSLLRMLLETTHEVRTISTSLQLILTSGEPLFVADCQKVLKLLSPNVQIVNQYGPTECTMTSTYYALDPSWQEREIVLVGKPIPGMQVYILDHALNLVPPGIQGDVYLSGAGVARSYLRQAVATAERFLPHPWSTAPGQRLYQTGDIARYRPDGNIELLGRSDHQVKIRGNRVELGEIEAALSWHPQVKQSVLLMQTFAQEEKQLIAYVVIEKSDGEDTNITQGELRSFLQERLPDYMLPVHFVLLDELPLTHNGKVDRQALASLDVTIEPSRFVQFRDAVEYQLRDIWSELLNKHPISINDNFFDLGGHSILAVRLLSHIKRTFDRDLPLAALFQHQTVAELAVLLREQLPPEEDTAALVPFQIHGDRNPFFCVHPSGGEVFEYRNLSRYLGTDQPFYGLRMPDPRAHLEDFSTLEGIATYYIAAIREVQPEGPYQIGGWSAGGRICYEMAQQLQQAGQEVHLLALIDSKPPKSDQSIKEDEKAGTDDAAIARSLMRRYQLTLPEELELKGEPTELLNYVYEQLKQQDIAPRDVRIEQIRFFAHVHSTIKRANDNYVPRPYAGQVILLKAEDEDVLTTNTTIDSWKALATQMHVHHVPGDHITMIEEPHVKDLAEALAHYLDTDQPL